MIANPCNKVNEINFAHLVLNNNKHTIKDSLINYTLFFVLPFAIAIMFGKYLKKKSLIPPEHKRKDSDIMIVLNALYESGKGCVH